MRDSAKCLNYTILKEFTHLSRHIRQNLRYVSVMFNYFQICILFAVGNYIIYMVWSCDSVSAVEINNPFIGENCPDHFHVQRIYNRYDRSGIQAPFQISSPLLAIYNAHDEGG